MALLGLSSLAGVIISHVIVLFEYIEEAHERGEPLRRAVIDAALVRLRPVLVTVLATVGGLIPLVIKGGPLWEPLCYVQIVGLLSATLVTKVVVPVLYVLFVEDFKLIAWARPGEHVPRDLPASPGSRRPRDSQPGSRGLPGKRPGAWPDHVVSPSCSKDLPGARMICVKSPIPRKRTIMDVTLTIPDELATRLRGVEDRLPEILELGLREWLSIPSHYAGLSDLLETLARLPLPEEILALRPTPPLRDRIEHLLQKNRAEGFSADEQREWERYAYIEHLVRLAKARAIQRRSNP